MLFFSNKTFDHSSSGIRVLPCTRTGGRTDMTKLIVAFRNFTNAPKNSFHDVVNASPVARKVLVNRWVACTVQLNVTCSCESS